MKNIKLLFFSVVLIIGPVLLEACCWDCDTDCYARKHPAKKFSIKEIDLIVGVRYSSPFRYASHSMKVSTLDYQFTLERQRAFFGPFKPTMGAYAANDQCVVEPVASNETLQSFKVVSNNPMETDLGNFAAGDDLMSLFYLSDGGKDTPFHAYYFSLLPIFKIKTKSEHVFTFSLLLSDGRKFEFETANFELLPE